MSAHWKSAVELILQELEPLHEHLNKEYGGLASGMWSGPNRVHAAITAMSRSCAEILRRINKMMEALVPIHSPPLTCLPGRCHLCLLICGIDGMRTATKKFFENTLEKYRKSHEKFGVYSEVLCLDYQMMLECHRTAIPYLRWTATFVKLISVRCT